MSKIKCTYHKLAMEALENSDIWLNEANHLLFERNSYGHSLSLSLIAIEESVKAFICYTVAWGLSNDDHPLVKDIFISHEEKMNVVILFYLVFNVPLLFKMMQMSLTEVEIEELYEFFRDISLDWDKSLKEFEKLRQKGIYVDIVDNDIKTPKEIAKDTAEGIFFRAFQYSRTIKNIIDYYESVDEEERENRLSHAKEIAKIAFENIARLKSNVVE